MSSSNYRDARDGRRTVFAVGRVTARQRSGEPGGDGERQVIVTESHALEYRADGFRSVRLVAYGKPFRVGGRWVRHAWIMAEV